jgi:glycosyltransferase involved in cell wall biosynthesis
VNYKGGVKSEEVSSIISAYHFLILPTFNENYGHVIVESFSNGKPVIISDQTPWRGLEDKRVGWDIPLNNISKFEQVLRECISMDAEEYMSMSSNALGYAEKYCNSENSVQQMQQMFKNAVNE